MELNWSDLLILAAFAFGYGLGWRHRRMWGSKPETMREKYERDGL